MTFMRETSGSEHLSWRGHLAVLKQRSKSTGVLPPSKYPGWHSAFALPSQMLKGESKTNQNQHAGLCPDYLKRKCFSKTCLHQNLWRKSVLLNTKSGDPETHLFQRFNTHINMNKTTTCFHRLSYPM